MIIDDLGMRKQPVTAAEDLLELVMRRYERHGTVITSNRPVLALALVLDAMARLADGDESAADQARKALDDMRKLDDDDDDDHDVINAPKPTTPKKAKAKRIPLSAHDLPVEDVVIVPDDIDLSSGGFERIGEDISEHIDRRSASLVRVRLKNAVVVGAAIDAAAAADVLPSTTIVQAEMPDRPLQKSNAGPGLLAHVLVSKYADHLPLHRQQQIFKREGFRLPTSTMSDWVQALLLCCAGAAIAPAPLPLQRQADA